MSLGSSPSRSGGEETRPGERRAFARRESSTRNSSAADAGKTATKGLKVEFDVAFMFAALPVILGENLG